MPETSNKIVKTAINLVDDTFDTAQSENYHLSIQTERDRLSFCILNAAANQYIVLRDYPFCSTDPCALVSECSSIFENDDFLGLKYKSSSHLWISSRCTLVPEHLFDEGETESYLTFNHGSIAGELTLHHHIKSAGVYHIFSCPESLMNLLRLHQPDITLYHHATPFIESVIGMSSSIGLCMAVYFYSNCLDIAVVEYNRLLFYNTFQISTPEDSVYYLAGVSNLFAIDLSLTKLLYVRNSEHIPPEMAILRNYVERIVDIKLIHLYRCES